MSKTIDFDAFREERAEDNIYIKAFGEELELPPSPPLANMLEIIEMNERMGEKADIPQKQIKQMLELSLGKKQFDKLLEKGMTMEEANWLVKELWNIYNKVDTDKDDTKNNQPSPSQKNGDS